MSVTTLLSMPLAEGLFGQAIAQSGAGAHTFTTDEGRMVGGYLAADDPDGEERALWDGIR